MMKSLQKGITLGLIHWNTLVLYQQRFMKPHNFS